MKSFDLLLVEYENFLKGLGYAKNTVPGYIGNLKRFYEGFLKPYGKTDLRDINQTDLLQYLKLLKEKDYKKGTIEGNFTAIKGFFNFLFINETILINPIEELEINIKAPEGKRGVFSKEEMNLFLDSIDIKKPYGKRDRAIFELMYAGGLRIGETCSLNVENVDLRDRILTIRDGKGGKDRLVPFSETALKFLNFYMNTERKKLLKKRFKKEESLFLNKDGKRIRKNTIRNIFNKHLEECKIDKGNRTLHSIRHSTATHLLESGANVLYVSELLGHENVETTAGYTHLSMEHLKRVYKSAHPRENTYFDEVDEKYLEEVEKLKQELLNLYP